jgi:hypothetical protein
MGARLLEGIRAGGRAAKSTRKHPAREGRRLGVGMSRECCGLPDGGDVDSAKFNAALGVEAPDELAELGG